MRIYRQLRALTLSVSVAALCAPVFAQTGDDETSREEMEMIVVTGSRIARTTFETPTPVTAVSKEQLDAKAAPTVAELILEVPALRPNKTTFGGRSLGVSTFNLRSLGPQRTLTLLDGQRLMPSSPIAGFDLNIIPAPLLERVEVATAGASSVYGSDAVAGVVNVSLTRDLEGGSIDAQYAGASHGDHETVSVTGAYGTQFASGRGHIVFGASYLERPDILYQGARSWGSQGWTRLTNTAYTPDNDEPRQVIVPNARLSNMTLGGLITSDGPLKNIQFGANGEQSLFDQGTNVGRVWSEGGDGLMPQGDLFAIDTATRNESFLSSGRYELTSGIEATFHVLGTRSRNYSTNNWNYNNANITIRQDNAFLPDNIRTIMIDNNLDTITMGRLNPEMGINDNLSRNEYYRVGAGLTGSFSGGWTWDINAHYTDAEASNRGRNNRIQANWTRALDSVIGPNGQPICRSTLTDPDDGCVPANVFGLNALSVAAVEYSSGTSEQRSFTTSADINANIVGDVGATWAGPISFAAGVEYRDDEVDSRSDPISDISGWRQGTFASFAGDVSVAEVYGETSIPLLSGQPLAEQLNVDLAARYVDYSTSGGTTVWKAGINWVVNDQLRIRGALSEDFRAPTINDLFARGSLRAGQSVVDYIDNAVTIVDTLSGGNPNLNPEVAQTFTVGAVFQPESISAFQLSVDYFDIELDDALTLAGAQVIVDRCGEGDMQFCSAIDRNAGGEISLVRVTNFNAAKLETSGVDIEAVFGFPLSSLFSNASGDISISNRTTYVDSLLTTTIGGTQLEGAGQIGQFSSQTPHWRSVTSVNYYRDALSVRLLLNYIDGGKDNNNWGPKDININDYSSFTYVDVSVRYDVSERAELYAKVENLFDRDPPLLASNVVNIAPASFAPYHDHIGRSFGVGLRYLW